MGHDVAQWDVVGHSGHDKPVNYLSMCGHVFNYQIQCALFITTIL